MGPNFKAKLYWNPFFWLVILTFFRGKLMVVRLKFQFSNPKRINKWNIKTFLYFFFWSIFWLYYYGIFLLCTLSSDEPKVYFSLSSLHLLCIQCKTISMDAHLTTKQFGCIVGHSYWPTTAKLLHNYKLLVDTRPNSLYFFMNYTIHFTFFVFVN